MRRNKSPGVASPNPRALGSNEVSAEAAAMNRRMSVAILASSAMRLDAVSNCDSRKMSLRCLRIVLPSIGSPCARRPGE